MAFSWKTFFGGSYCHFLSDSASLRQEIQANKTLETPSHPTHWQCHFQYCIQLARATFSEHITNHSVYNTLSPPEQLKPELHGYAHGALLGSRKDFECSFHSESERMITLAEADFLPGLSTEWSGGVWWGWRGDVADSLVMLFVSLISAESAELCNWNVSIILIASLLLYISHVNYSSPPVIRTPLLPKNSAIIRKVSFMPLVRWTWWSTTCIHSTCCQKNVLYKGVSFLESVL